MSKPQKEWTIMVYMAGDNNLSRDMAYAMRALQDTISSFEGRANLLVYFDGSVTDSPSLYLDFTDPNEPIAVPASQVPTKRWHSDGRARNWINENSASMYSLYNFVHWCLSDEDNKRGKEAKKHALIVSGHGSGFQNMSFLSDNRAAYYMTVPKFRKTLDWITNDLLGGNKLDLVGFDNCVMGMLEIAHELEPYCKFMVASEGNIPNAGWTYGSMLSASLGEAAASDPNKFAASLVRSFIEQQKRYALAGIAVDMSAWDLSKVGPVVSAVDELGKLIISVTDPAAVARIKTLMIQAHYDCQSYMFEQNVDLKDLTECIIQNLDLLEPDRFTSPFRSDQGTPGDLHDHLGSLCRKVVDKVEESIELSGFTGGKYQYSNGIAIFFPWSDRIYKQSRPIYERLDFVKNGAPNWNKFLERFLGALTKRGPRPAEVNQPKFEKMGTLNFAQDSLTLEPSGIPGFMTKAALTFDRTKNNTADRTENNTADRTENNTADRTENNTADKLLNAIGLTTVDFKNIATPWYVSGYSDNPYSETIAEIRNIIREKSPEEIAAEAAASSE